MRTRYFQDSSLSDDGKKDLQKLASLSAESANQILDWLLTRDSYPRYDSADLVELAKLTRESGETLISVLGILKLFVDRMVDKDDDPQSFYADIKDLNVVDEKTGYSTLDLVFSRIPGVLDKFRLFSRRKATEGLGAPILTGATMTAALKPIFARKFRYQEDSIQSYSPKPIGYCVVAQVELVKGDSDHVFAFQVNRDNFDRFLADLLALQAEMQLLTERAESLREADDER